MAEEISNNKGSSAGTKSDDQVSSANDFSLSDQSVIRNDSDGVGVLFGTEGIQLKNNGYTESCLLYTSPSPRDQRGSRMPSSA